MKAHQLCTMLSDLIKPPKENKNFLPIPIVCKILSDIINKSL